MIHFKTIQWKNFLSTGNAFTTLKLDARPTSLVIGENGSGKSTMLDAICFALFGKPYRNINKPQLVNTINDKNCVVEIEFDIGSKQYKIIRGIKPTIFEIWVNGELINQDAASKDYQRFLEESILKLNYKSFTQIVILGSASFTPFMQLPAAARREVIEDILDIKVFTAMNIVLKEKASDLKSKMSETDTKITIARNKAEVQQEYIKTLQDDRDERIQELDLKIIDSTNEIQQKRSEILVLETTRDELYATISDHTDITKNLHALQHDISNFESQTSKANKELQFFKNNDVCPKCRQDINLEFKKLVVEDNQREHDAAQSNIHICTQQIQHIMLRLQSIKAVERTIEELRNTITGVRNDILSIERYIQRLHAEKNHIASKVGNIEVEQKKLKTFAKETLSIAKERSDMNELQHYYDIAGMLLKDSGIKTRVIKQYLPVINKLVNKYLTDMDFFVQFTLNEKFDEVIKSRHRDDFSYESFSEGEKQRIDLSLLFTWRTIAKLKNSASTNLLILDEIFDSSLDSSATEYVMNLLNTLGEGTNVWVISHKGDQLFDKFSSAIRFTKKQNFSVIV